MRPPVDRMFGHIVTVQAYAGTGASGPVYADAVTVRCRVNAGRRTLPDGRTLTVVQAHPRDGGSLPTPAHLEVVVE